MDIKFTTLLYSKYSVNSKKFMDMLDQIPENVKSEFKLNLLCIDNEKVRKSILNSNQINIKIVPCILLIYADGGVQKYEGPDAFVWIEEIISKLTNNIEQQRIEEEKQKLIEEKKMFEQQKFLEQQRLMEEQRLLEEQRIEQEKGEHVSSRKRKVVPAPPLKAPPKKSNKTSIMEIETESEGEEEEEMIFEDPNPRIETKESTDALSQKKETLMSAAMAMQKSRESQESSIKKMPMMNQR